MGESTILGTTTENTAYYGYTIRQDPVTRKWRVYWKDKPLDQDFASEAEAEEWIDEQIPLNR